MKGMRRAAGIFLDDLRPRVRGLLVFTAAWLVVAGLSIAGCDRPNRPAVRQAQQQASDNKWMGRWSGPEGTYLELSRSGDRISIHIENLDNVKRYEGTAAADSISFVRDGKVETIHAGNGRQTGMKWLADKKDCLVIRSGEGYCRD
jgi:hypothetical protein